MDSNIYAVFSQGIIFYLNFIIIVYGNQVSGN